MREILNSSEFEAIINSAPITDGHTGLIEILHVRYPGTPFRIIAEWHCRSWDVGIIDANGNRIADHLGKWVDQKLAAVGGSAREVWERHKHEGLIQTERKGAVLFLTAPYGSEPDAFYQLEVLVGAEIATQLLFDPKDYPPITRQELLTGPSLVFGDDECQVLKPPQYRFETIHNVRQHLRNLVKAYKANRLAEYPAMQKEVLHVQDICHGPDGWQTSTDEMVPFLELCPDWLDRLPPEYRLFQDWAESSAGLAGIHFCDHWLVEAGEWTDNSKELRQYSMIPQWADADGGLDLPEIKSSLEASPYGVIEYLDQFDQQVGYPFAWYFYMLHGNRVTSSAGREE